MKLLEWSPDEAVHAPLPEPTTLHRGRTDEEAAVAAFEEFDPTEYSRSSPLRVLVELRRRSPPGLEKPYAEASR